MKNTETNIINEIGLSEIVWDSLNPKFIKKFELETHFIEIENLILEV